MIILVIFTILLTLLLLGTGILLVFSDRWMPKLLKMMSSTPPQSSIIASIGVWKLKALGIFQIVVSIFVFISIAAPNVGSSLPFIITLIPFIAYILLGWVMLAFSIRNKKAASKK